MCCGYKFSRKDQNPHQNPPYHNKQIIAATELGDVGNALHVFSVATINNI